MNDVRPSIDVVIPFRGSEEELQGVLGMAKRLRLRADDRLVIADNTLGRHRHPAWDPRRRVVHATGRQSSYFARNRGATFGSAPWILFLDADVEPPVWLLDAYFDPPPSAKVAILAGGVADAAAAQGAPPAARYAAARQPMSQDNTLDTDWPYAQTANCLVRRSAFAEAGGFNETLRSGGDADLCFRIREAGWRIERREGAEVIHRNRATVRDLLRQKARHGAGAAWLNREYPGSFPPANAPGTVAWSGRRAVVAARSLARGNRDAAVAEGVDVLTRWAFELGRRLPNRAPEQPHP